MATISLPGLNSGIDTSAIIQQLMIINRRGVNLLESRKASWQKKSDALAALESKLNAFKSASKTLSNAAALRGCKATSSDTDLVTAEASYNAFEGNHTVEVKQLASAERIVHAGMAYADDRVGAGTFIYSYNHKETVITTTDTTTLENLVGLINNDPDNPGVTASLLEYDDGSGGVFHLVLSGNDSGSDYDISINASSTNVLVADSAYTVKGSEAGSSTKIRDLDPIGTLGAIDRITIGGADKNGTAITRVDLTITANTTIGRLLAEIEAAYGGNVTATLEDGKIRLTDNTDGASLTSLTLTFTDTNQQTAQTSFTILTKGGEVIADLAGFENGTFEQTQAAADAKVKVDGYPKDPVDGDGNPVLDENGNPVQNWIKRSSNTLSDVIPGVTLHLHAPTPESQPVQVNLTRETDSFKEKLNTFVTAYNDVVQFVKDNSGYDTQTRTAGVLMGDYTVTDIRSKIRTPFLTVAAGFTTNVDSFLMPGQIGLEVDSEGILKLDQTKLSEALDKDYMGVLELVGAEQKGSSDSKSIRFYSAGTSTVGGEYDVEVSFDNGVIVSARIKLKNETTWRSATVDGNLIIGNGQFDDKGRPLYPENGFSLTAEYSGSGTQTLTATVRVKQGFAGGLEDTLNNILSARYGTIQIDQSSVDDTIKQLQDRIDRENTRLEKVQQRLVDRFARLEKTLALLQSQRSALGL